MKFFAWVSIFLAFAAPVFFLSIGRWISGCYYLLFLASIAWIIREKPQWEREDRWVALVLAAPIMAVVIGQLLRWDWRLSEWDAPIRLLAGIPIYLMFKHQIGNQINNTKKVLQGLVLGSAIGLLFLPFFIDEQRTIQFGGRIATVIADPNTFGSYVGVLFLFVCAGLFSVHVSKQETSTALMRGRLVIYGAALITGFILILQAQSRGSWLAWSLGYLILALIALRGNLVKLAVAILIPLGLITTFFSSDQLRARVSSIVPELSNGTTNKKENSSGGIRLNMAIATFMLAKERPWSGYGDMGYSKRLYDEDFKARFSPETIHVMSSAGPHQEILARTLQSGMWGLAATLLLFLGPIAFFSIKSRSVQKERVFAAQIGLIFCCQLLALQFTIEPFSLKFTTTFNALILSMLFGITNAKTIGARDESINKSL